MSIPTVWDHLLIVIVGIILPLYTLFVTRPGLKQGVVFDTTTRIQTYWVNSMALWGLAGLILLVWKLTGRQFSGLGLQFPTEGTLRFTLVLSLVLVTAYLVDSYRKLATPGRRTETREKWKRDTPFMPSNRKELLHSIVFAVSAGVCEEIVFRGYIISYLLHYTGGSLTGLIVAIVAPAAIFGLSHLYQGWSAVAKIFLLAILFGLLFVRTGSLLVPMLIHALIDLAGSFVGVWFGHLDRME